MALGDITRDKGFPISVGNLHMLSGTLEASDTETAFALCDTNSRLISVQVEDEDGVGSASVEINQNAAATETMGTCSIFVNSKTVQTLRFVAYYI